MTNALSSLPSLVGVIHLPALPGSPRSNGDLGPCVERAKSEAAMLRAAGFDGVVIENFGDAPFFPRAVDPITIASMTACAIAAREGAGSLPLGVNILRNDAHAALAVAIASGADFIRVNVHTGARVTDQGLVEGAAHETMRLRRALSADRIKVFCDVDVKHSAPLAARPIDEEAHEIEGRGLADAILVTGSGTGRAASEDDLTTVVRAVSVPVYVASGVTLGTLARLRLAHGVIVGTALRKSGRAGDPIDQDLAARFAEAYRAARV